MVSARFTTANAGREGRRYKSCNKLHASLIGLYMRRCAYLPSLPYAYEKAVATQTAPPTMLPSVTGNRLLSRKAFHETAAPLRMPSGMMNMLATECSRPIATNAEIGNLRERAARAAAVSRSVG